MESGNGGKGRGKISRIDVGQLEWTLFGGGIILCEAVFVPLSFWTEIVIAVSWLRNKLDVVLERCKDKM